MATSLSIKGKNQANASTTATINYVNPDATNAQLVSLATSLNALTTNTIDDITKIQKESLTDATAKSPRNFTISPSTVNYSSIPQNIASPTMITLTYDGDGVPATTANLQNAEGTGTQDRIAIVTIPNDNNYSIGLARGTGALAAYGTITISLPETDTYESATATLTILN